MVDELALEQDYLWFSPANHHSTLAPYSPEQVTHYRILGL
jgi:hypothetical protein